MNSAFKQLVTEYSYIPIFIILYKKSTEKKNSSHKDSSKQKNEGTRRQNISKTVEKHCRIFFHCFKFYC